MTGAPLRGIGVGGGTASGPVARMAPPPAVARAARGGGR